MLIREPYSCDGRNFDYVLFIKSSKRCIAISFESILVIADSFKYY